MTSPLHIPLSCDPYIWPLWSLTQFVELSQLNTSSRFCQKHNFFRTSKIHSVSMWRITWLFLFMLSIPFGHLVVFILLLGWSFYNSKSSKPNGSASIFKRRSRRFIVGLLVTLSELPTPQLQWPKLVLAKALVKTPHQLNAVIISLLNKPQELWSIPIYLTLPFSLPFALISSSAF